jgi:LacI family transcriptional regulator
VKPKPVTLTDIATRLGISKYSVSRALTGKPGVSGTTRERVLHVARELGYQHPALEQRAGAAGDRTVVLLIPLQDLEDVEFWMGVIAGASSAATDLGYTFVTRPLDTSEDPARAPTVQVAGVIVAGSKARPAWRPYADAGVPASLITYATPLEPYDTVHAADWEGGAVVTDYLVGLGHRRLAYVTESPEKPSFAARARGFRETAQRHPGVETEAMHIDRDEPGVSFERAYRALVARRRAPTGMLASTDSTAFAVASALGRLGLGVPQDVSLVGFNDAIGSARFVPKLTTLSIPTRHIGAAAMRYLHERIEGVRVPARRLEFVPTLIVRDSTALYRADSAPRTGLEVPT